MEIENGYITRFHLGGEILKFKKSSKKKVLFLIDSLGGGGAEKVLTDIICNIDKRKFDITVQTIYNTGVYINKIKEVANYKYCFNNLPITGNKYQRFINKIRGKFQGFLFKHPSIFFKTKYDIEIAFLESISTKFISKVPKRGAKRVAWVHSDLIVNPWTDRLYTDVDEHNSSYNRFDKIVCVSESTKKAFLKKFNIPKEKVSVQYNPIDEKKILEKSKEIIEDVEISKKFKIVTVGRLVSQKGHIRLLEVCKQLFDEGFDFEVWIIGEGPERENLERFTIINNLSSNIKLLGFKENPYKYVKQCDLYVSTSYVEGYPLVIAEALAIGLPILATDCSGLNELIGYGKYGLLVDSDSIALYEGLKKMLSNQEFLKFYKCKAIERSREFKLEKSIKEVERLLEA